MQKLDQLDWQIVRFLRDDGRLAFREIARQVGVTEGTVRNRVNALLESGFMRIIAVADPIRLGVPILATTYARIRPDALEAFCAQLEASPRVCYLGIGLGHKNVVVESLHADAQDLFAFTQAYYHTPEVLEYDTVQVLNIRKSTWNWDLINPEGQPHTDWPESADPTDTPEPPLALR